MDGAGSEIGGGVPDEKGGEHNPRENPARWGRIRLLVQPACPASSLTAANGGAEIDGDLDQTRRGQRLRRSLSWAAGGLTRMTLPGLPRKGKLGQALSVTTSTAPKARGSRRKLGTVRNPQTASA